MLSGSTASLSPGMVRTKTEKQKAYRLDEYGGNNAQLVKQNIKLLQVITKQQDDVISNQQVALQGLDKAIARERYTSRVEICGALVRTNIVIWWHNNQNSNAN